MSNLLNHKCKIIKRKGSFSDTDVKNILSKIEAKNYIYSDYYIFIKKDKLYLEYIAKYYPLFFKDKIFSNYFDLIDIYSDAGGAPDSINVIHTVDKTLYEFDEVHIAGGFELTEFNHNSNYPKNNQPQIIHTRGAIVANTYNESITSSSNKKTIIIDDQLAEKMINDSLEIWSIKTTDSQYSKCLMNLIKPLDQYPQKRGIKNLTSVSFLNKGKSYFTYSWNAEKEVWENKRKFNLWDIVKLEQ